MSKRTVMLRIALAGAKDAPTEFRIFAAGLNESEKGPWIFSERSAAAVMAEYEQHGKALGIDYNHGTTLPYPTPEQGVAAGEFVPEVRATDAGPELWATNVKWTDIGGARVAGGEYRWISPCFEHDFETREVTRLINVALTNLPALDHIESLVAASRNANAPEDRTMTDEQIKALQTRNEQLETENRKLREGTGHVVALSAALGMTGDKAAADQLPAVQGLVALRAEVFAVTGEKTPEKAVAALHAIKANADKVVTMQAEIEAAKTAALRAELDSVWDQADKDKKLHRTEDAPKVEASLVALTGGKLTPEVVKAAKLHVEMLSAKVPAAGAAAVPPPTGAGGGLSDSQRALLARHGLDPKIGEQQAARIKDRSAMGAQQ